MAITLFLFYFSLFCGLYYWLRLPQRTGLSFWLICILFGIKVLAGLLNLYFHNSQYLTNDAHYYFLEANIQLAAFAQQPWQQLAEWFFNWGDIIHHINFLNSENAVYWSDVGRLLHLRFMIVCNMLSFGNEYVNIIFYNAFFFIGLLALYKTFLFLKPNQKWVFIIIIFCIPSVTFWNSGIHKDGFILSLFGLVSWFTHRFIQQKSAKNALILLFFLFLLLAFRYFYFLVLLPFYLLFFLLQQAKSPFLWYASAALLGVGVFLYSGSVTPKFNLLKFVTNKQDEFLKLKGYSDMGTPILENTPRSYIKNFPVAIQHIFIEPIPKMGDRLKYDITAIDSILILLLLFLAFIFLRYRNFQMPYLWLVFYFSIFSLAFIGYTIPNLGALVRYESPFICLLLLSLFAMGNFTLKPKLSIE